VRVLNSEKVPFHLLHIKKLLSFKFHPLFLFLVTATMLVGGRDCRTQFWKVITNGPFHQSLVLNGQVVSEENIFSNMVAVTKNKKRG
jgi:hypothetical protein